MNRLIQIAKKLNQGKSFWVFLFVLFVIVISSLNFAIAESFHSQQLFNRKELKFSKTIQQETSLNTLFTLDDIEFEEDTELDPSKKLITYIFSILTVSRINSNNEKFYLSAQKHRYQKIRIYIINQVFRN